MKTDKRVMGLDYVRLLCNYMVIMFHSYPFMYFTSKGFDYWSMTYLVYYLGDVFLPTLFMVSDWLMFRNWTWSWGSFAKKLWSRFKRLFVPHVCWNALYFVLFVIIGYFVPRAAGKLARCQVHDVWDFVKLVLPVPGWPLIDSALLFVQALIVLALISPIIYLIFRYCHKYLIFLIGIIPIAVLFFAPKAVFAWYKFPAYSLSCFYFGGWVAYSRIDLCELCVKNRKWLVPMGFLAVTAAFILYMNGINTDDCSYGLRDIELLLAAPMLLALSGVITRICDRPWVKSLLPIAFFLYAGHGIIISMIMHSLGGAGVHPWFIWCVSVVVTPIVLILWWKAWNYVSSKSLKLFDGSL